MLVRPGPDDARSIVHNTTKVVSWLGLAMLVPAALAALVGEWNSATGFLVGAGLTVGLGRTAAHRTYVRGPLDWSHGMVTAALVWLVGSLAAAVPLFLSGHFATFLDAYLEAMSGLTTTGLSLAQDLEHMPLSVQLWRHLLQLLGGQAVIIVALTLFTSASAQAGLLFSGAGRQERLAPDIPHSIRRVAPITACLLALAFTATFGATLVAGLPLWSAIEHAVMLSLSGVNTGGFALHTTSVAYYHSVAVEVVLIVVMLAGALSYAVHHQLWTGQRLETTRNLEVRTFALTLLVLAGLALSGLGRSGTFSDAAPLFRKGWFAIVSAHTTTGLTVTPPRLVVSDWGLIAPAALVGAMAIGGTFGSAAGGIKTLRLGLLLKSVAKDVRRVLLPESALVVSTYVQERRHTLTDGQVRAVATVLLLYLLTYLTGGLVGLFYGEDFTQALFESVAAASNGGLPAEVLAPTSPAPLKLWLLVAMWVGRLEFMAVFALFGYVFAYARGRT